MATKQLYKFLIAFEAIFIITFSLILNCLIRQNSDMNNAHYMALQIIYIGSELLGLAMAIPVAILLLVLSPSKGRNIWYLLTTILFLIAFGSPMLVGRQTNGNPWTIMALPGYLLAGSLLGMCLSIARIRVLKRTSVETK